MIYKIEIPDELDGRLAEIARDYGSSKVEVIKKFIKLGLVAVTISEDPTSSIIIRENGRERELEIF